MVKWPVRGSREKHRWPEAVFLEKFRNNTGSVEVIYEVSPEKRVDPSEELTRKNSVSASPSLLKMFMHLRRLQGAYCYSVFIFKPLHSSYLEIVKLVQECKVNY